MDGTPERGDEHVRPDAGWAALGAIGRIVKAAPAIVDEVLRADARMTRRWGHGALHDRLGPLVGHVVITYYGAAQEIAWRRGRERLASRTRTGSITIIPDGHAGRWDIEGPIGVSHVYLTEARLQACADAIGGDSRLELLARVGFDDAPAARVMELVSREEVATGPASRLFVEQAIDLLCIQLVRAHSPFGAPAVQAPRRGLPARQVSRVTRYMRERLADDISLDELAGVAGLSRFHFCTAFRQATGQTPHTWLTGLRMSRARELLGDARLTVTDVALAVGYQTPSAFTAAFRRLFDTTPSAFRRGL